MLDEILQHLVRFSRAIPHETPRSLGIGHPRPQDREPRVITIDGKRGMGKTSLFLTLLEAWYSVRDGKPAAEAWTPTDAAGRQVLADSLIIEGVDFDPHPHEMSAYAAIVSTLAPLARAADRNAPRGRDSADGLEERWRQQLADVLAGWDAGGARGLKFESLDDWAWSAIQQTTKWRELRESWTSLVNDILAGLPNRELGSRGLVVVPIDDVDMRIDSVRSLLLAVRHLHHPRLVYLVGADREQVNAGIELEIMSSVPSAADPSLIERLSVPRLARQIAEKTLPLRTSIPVDGLDFRDVFRRTFNDENGRALVLDHLLSEIGMDDPSLWSALYERDTIGHVPVSARLRPGERQYSYRDARDCVLAVRNRRERLTSDTDRRIAFASTVQTILSRLVRDPTWEFVVEGGTAELRGDVRLRSAAPPHAHALPSGLYVDRTTLVTTNNNPVDELLLLAREMVARDEASAVRVLSQAPDTVDDLRWSWARYFVDDGRVVPWPAGVPVGFDLHRNSWTGRARPDDAQPALHHAGLAASWIATQLPGPAFSDSDLLDSNGSLDRERLVARLRRAAGPGRENERDIFSFVFLLAAPESGLDLEVRADLVELLADFVAASPENLDAVLVSYVSDAQTLSRQRRTKFGGREPLLMSVNDDPLQLLTAWIGSPQAWWTDPQVGGLRGLDRVMRGPNQSFQWFSSLAGLRRSMHHEVMSAFGLTLRRPSIYAATRAAVRRYEASSPGSGAPFVCDLWRAWCEEYGQHHLADVLDAPRGLVVNAEWRLRRPAEPIGVASKSVFVGGRWAVAGPGWDLVPRGGPLQQQECEAALCALLIVASAFAEDRHEQAAQPMFQEGSYIVPWPDFGNSALDEHLRCMLAWAAERANSRPDRLKPRMPAWMVLCGLRAALCLMQETNPIAQLAEPPAGPGFAHSVFADVANIMRDDRHRAWCKDVFENAPMLIDGVYGYKNVREMLLHGVKTGPANAPGCLWHRVVRAQSEQSGLEWREALSREAAIAVDKVWPHADVGSLWQLVNDGVLTPEQRMLLLRDER